MVLIIKKLFSNIWSYVITLFIILLGVLKYEKYSNKKLKKEIENKEIEIQVQKDIADIKEFQAINKKEVVDADTKEYDTNIKPNTTIRL